MKVHSLLIAAALSLTAMTSTAFAQDAAITKAVVAMNDSLLEMSCPVATHVTSGPNEETQSKVCVRADLPNETRPEFKNISYEITMGRLNSGVGNFFALRAVYPVGFKVDQKNAEEFLGKISAILDTEVASHYRMFPLDGFSGWFKNGRGVLVKTFRTPNVPVVIFDVKLVLSTEVDAATGQERTVVTVSTGFDA